VLTGVPEEICRWKFQELLSTTDWSICTFWCEK